MYIILLFKERWGHSRFFDSWHEDRGFDPCFTEERPCISAWFGMVEKRCNYKCLVDKFTHFFKYSAGRILNVSLLSNRQLS